MKPGLVLLGESVMGKIEVWAHPASRQEGIEWNAWRKCWEVSVRETPTEGKANAAIVRLLARTVGVPLNTVRLVSGGRARGKLVEIDEVSDSEIDNRLRRDKQLPATAGR